MRTPRTTRFIFQRLLTKSPTLASSAIARAIHVLKHENRMVVVKVHIATFLHPTLHRVSHRLRALVQHVLDAAAVALELSFSCGKRSSELGSVLEHEPECCFDPMSPAKRRAMLCLMRRTW